MDHRISIVTTNLNGAVYLEQAIRSVLDQEYPNLEYIIIDGGSTDGSQRIIERYERRLAYWESEKDKGFAHAYNKGFARATGEILAYLNSDDLYCPWALRTVNRIFSDLPMIQWLTSLFPVCHSPQLDFVSVVPAQPFNGELYRAGFYGAGLQGIQQESTFWRKGLWLKAGGYMNEDLQFAIDAELWARFFDYAELYAVATSLGGFRVRPDSKSGAHMTGYLDEMAAALQQSTARNVNESNLRINHTYKTARRLELTRRVLNRLCKGKPFGGSSFEGKTVHWHFDEKRFVARTSPITITI